MRKKIKRPVEEKSPAQETIARIRVGQGEEEGFAKMSAKEAWPDVPDETVEYVVSAFDFHRLTQPERFRFMNETFRVLIPGGKVTLLLPEWKTDETWADPLYQWPPVNIESFKLYQRAWREANGYGSLDLVCDFDNAYHYGQQANPNIAVRNQDYQTHAKKHWVNVLDWISVTMTKPHTAGVL